MKAQAVDMSDLYQEILELLGTAHTADEVKGNVTREVLSIAQRAKDADEFLTACRNAEKAWKEQSKATKLPQTYNNAKSTVKFALRHNIPLVQGKAKLAKSFNQLRLEVAERRAASRIARISPEKGEFTEAVREVEKANPLVMLTCARMMRDIVKKYKDVDRDIQSVVRPATEGTAARPH